MSLYGTRARSKTPGPIPIWPYYFLSILSLLVALGACFIFWQRDIPSEDELVKTGGKIRTIMIRDDISNTGAGAMLPIFTSVYIRFKDVEGEFRYPWTFARYGKVRNEVGVSAEIWVEREAIGRDDAPLIWGLTEINHFKDEDRQTVIVYEDLVEGQRKNGKIVVNSSIVLVATALVFWLLGKFVGRRNRRKFPDFYS